MSRHTTTIRSPWPQEQAFQFMADARNFEQWDPGTVRSTQVAGDGAGLGAEYDVEVKTPGGTTTMRYRTVHFEQPWLVELDVRTDRLTGSDRIEVAPDGAGSLVTYSAELAATGWTKILGPALAVAFGRAFTKGADRLTQVLEGQQVAA